MGGNSCINRSLVAGLSGGTISRDGGGTGSTIGGHGTGLCAQPPSQSIAPASSSVELRVEFTFYPLAPSHVGLICGLSVTQGARGGLFALGYVRMPLGTHDRCTGLRARPVRRPVP
jgi:hypothetical protein